MKILILLFTFPLNVFANENLALKKIQQFGKILKKELKIGLKESPIKAIEVCNINAPKIQTQVSTNNLKIGRVSLKNRNPENVRKDWMKVYTPCLRHKGSKTKEDKK